MRRTATLLFSHSSSLFVSVLALPSLSLNKTWRNENKSNALAYKCKSASALPGWMEGGNLRFLVFCFFVLRRCILVTRSLEKHRTSKPVKTIHWLTVQSLRICRNTTKNSRKSQFKEKEKRRLKETVVQITILLSLTFARRHRCFRPFVVILMEVRRFSVALESRHWNARVDSKRNHRDRAEE